VIGTVNLTEMWGLVEQLAPSPEGSTRIVDAEHRILAASGDRDKEAVFDLRPEPPSVPQLLPDARSQVFKYGAESGQMLRASAPIETLRWRLVLEQPVQVAFAAVSDHERRLGATVAMFLAAAALVGAVGARMVTRPLRALTERTREIARGELV